MIVVIADGKAVAVSRMHLSSQAGRLPVRRERTLNRQPPQHATEFQILPQGSSTLFHEIVSQAKGRLNVSLNIEIVKNVGFAECQFAGPHEHLAQSSRMRSEERRVG